MLAVVKTPRTKIQIQGEIAPRVLRVLEHEYGDKLVVTPEENLQTVDFFSTTLSKTIKKQMNPSQYIKMYRSNKNMTQSELGSYLNVSSAFVCDLEKNRRAVSKDMAKKLAKLFGTSIDRFL
jgi:DNA-binding XRE family transcriptional regulator